MGEFGDLSPERIEEYRRYVSQAKQEARSGNLEASLQLFQQALEIHSSEKLTANIKKLEEALASLAVEEDEDDGFVDVCQSGLLLYGEMHEKLFDYQREGVAFLYKLYRDRRKGGILADDMGLGKTVQIIAFLSGMFDAELIRSVLLILPATLLNNWEKEFAKWTPGLRVKVFHGINKAERNRCLERIQRRKGILLTTYQMLINNWQQLSSFGGREFVWDYVILDEAHKIKSPSAKTTKSVHAIPSKHRILLTGTPIQNNLKELWALFDFACQGSLLGTSKTFQMEYEKPITKARTKDATPGEKALGLKISENLMSIIQPYFLRRTKDELQKKKKLELPNCLPENQSKDVAPTLPSLPRKNELIVWVFLTPIQEEIYRKFISLDHIKELLLSTRSPLAELNILKKLCDHPRLLSNRACSQLGLEASNYSEQEVGENEPIELPDMKRSIAHVSDEMLIQESGKLCFLVALLEKLQYEGHRTLVFSLSRKILDIIERVLTHRGFKLMRIDGTVTQLVEREKRIGMFQKDSDYSVFLLTTQVGGIGLTLTAASRVVIFDPSWNPATDAQAVDRAYRIGQKENVIIYRLITCGTVEEKIYRKQVFKDSLIRQSTGDKKNPYRYFTMQQLKELFILEDTRSSATQLQLQSLHAAQRKTDTELDEHIAYLHTLEIFGISDHDLMYTRETAHDDEAENEEAHRYIEQRVQKAQELVQLESQLNDQHMRNIRNTTEGAWLRDTDSSTQPKTKPSKSSPGDTLGPSTSERTNPTVVESPTPSTNKSPIPPPSPVVTPPAFISPVISNEVIDLTSDDDNGVVSDMVNLSAKMTSLVVEDIADEPALQIISNWEDALPSEEKEQQSPSFQACDLKPGTGLVSPFQTLSNKEDYNPVSSSKMTNLVVEDMADEQMLQIISNVEDALPSEEKEQQSPSFQVCDLKPGTGLVSPFQTLSNKEDYNPVSSSKMTNLVVEDMADEQMLQIISNWEDALPSEEKEHLSPSFQVCDLKPGTGLVSPFQTLSNKEDYNPVSSSKMTNLVVEDMADEQMLQIISNWEDALPSEEKEHLSPSFQVCDLKPGTGLVSPFQTLSNKEDYNPVSSSKMTSLVVEDMADEQMLQIISNWEDALPSEEKEHLSPSFQACDLKPGTGLVSPFQTNSVSIKEDYNPVSSSKMTSLVVEDIADEPALQIISNWEDALPSEEKEHLSPSFQACDLKPGTGLVSPLQTLSNMEDYNPVSSSKMTSLVVEDIADEPVLQIISNWEDALPSEEKEHQSPSFQACDLKPGTGLVSPLQTLSNKEDYNPVSSSKMTNLVVEDMADEQMLQIISNWEDALPSEEKEHLSPSFQACDLKPGTGLVSPLQTLSNKEDYNPVSSSKMTNLVVEDMVDEPALQIISNVEDALPSEEKEQQSPSFQACDLKPGTGLVSPFQTHSVSIKEDYSPASSAMSELPANNTDDEQMVFHTTNRDDLRSKNKEYRPTRLKADDQNESLNVSSLPQATSLLIEGNVNSESKRISCDPSPEARSELKDVQMKLLQDSMVYPSDDSMCQTEADMSVDVLHGDACEINEVDAVAPHETMFSKMTESIALQKSGVRETAQVKSLATSPHYQVNFGLALEDSENGPQTISEKDISLEETENEGFQLRLDSYCSSATESVGRERGSHRSLQASNGVEGSMVMDNSNGLCDSRDSSGLGKKKPSAIIILDEEEENDGLIDELDEDKPDGMCMSTPKTNKPIGAFWSSPRIKLSGRRSTASRRSLFDVVLEEVEGAAGEAGTASNVSNDMSVQLEFEEELTQNYNEQMSVELEEEPSGESLDPESKSSHFHDADSSRGESFL